MYKRQRAYNAEGYQQNRFDTVNDTLTNNQLVGYRTMVFLMPTIQATMSGLSLAIYWIGAVLINSSAMADKISLFSDMMVFSQYAIQVVMAFMMLVMIFMILPRAQVAADRINEVLETDATIKDGTREEGEPGRVGEIEFRDALPKTMVGKLSKKELVEEEAAKRAAAAANQPAA